MKNQLPTLTSEQFKRLAAEARFVSRAIGRTVTPGELLEVALNSQSLANAGSEISDAETAKRQAA